MAQPAPPALGVQTVDPPPARSISPIVAAALCIKPRLYAMQGFARTLRRDFDAARNAIAETWSDGQTEGQINRLKTLKRAGPELLRARMLPP